MSAIERCRTAALGGHVARCENCAHVQIAYNSCRNRHCPKCQGGAAKEWLAAREAELLPVPYHHVVFTLPAAIADVAYQNKAVIYDLLFKASAETLSAIAADPKHLLVAAHDGGRLQFFGNHAPLTEAQAFATYLAPLRNTEWVVYSKRPFGGPEAVLAYLARYTHRVAISNSRLTALDDSGVTFKWKDYRIEGPDRYKVMTLAPHEFIRRFLSHVLPSGFHRIRHYGLFANTSRAGNIARARELLAVPQPRNKAGADKTDAGEPPTLAHPCPCCGGRMIIIETFERGGSPRYRPTAPTAAIRIDTS